MERVVCTYGAFSVTAEKLSDNSEVHNVRFKSADGPLVILACTSAQEARDLAEAMEACVVDMTVREEVEA